MSSNIVTGNVTSYLQSVFHPEWSFSSTSGFMFQLDTSLMGNVDIGDLSTNYTLKLNGIEIAASGQGVASLNTLTGALTISTTTPTDISVYTGASTIYVDYIGTGGGTAGVTSICGLTGIVGLSAGVGIDISTHVNTSEIVITNLGVTTICGNLSADVGFYAGAGITITFCDTVTNGLQITNTYAIASDVCDWAIYRANSNVDLCGNYIHDTSGNTVTLSGNAVVTEGLVVVGTIMSTCGDLTVTSGNLAMASGNITATSAAFGGGVAVGSLTLGTSSTTVTYSALSNTICGFYDITNVRTNFGVSPASANDLSYGDGFSVITFAEPFADFNYILHLTPLTTVSGTLPNARAFIGGSPVNLKNTGSCAILTDIGGTPTNAISVYYTAIGRAT